ncbi:chondroitinase-B domain-containing protein [Aliiglaciecola litoralis]|uniref:Right handed beta helix region n=1 Tax=Aliiglaciecola litoralis TaxID=582857 RepID=A0ABP3WWV3_9ALTE
MKWWIAALLIITISLWLVLRYTVSGQYLTLKAKQYVELNVPKNTGFRQHGLKWVQSVLASFPTSQLLHYDRSKLNIGFQSHVEDKQANSANSTHQYLVSNVKQLQTTLYNAQPGDLIWLAPGDYQVTKRLSLGASGTQHDPIVLSAKISGSVRLLIDTSEGLYLDKSYWHIRNLIFNGVCQSDARCEHAIHVYGDADHIVIQNNQFIDFNAAIKANGNYANKVNTFADHVNITKNDFYNTKLRQTTTPSSPIDVVGGNNWVVSKNYIADFARVATGKMSVTYGAFMKGGGNDGLFEENVVNCASALAYQSHLDVRIGLSFGDGGTEKAFCQSHQCDTEHNGGKIRNNVILNCVNDVSIYLNKAAGTVISGNTLLNSQGIDARFPQTSVSVVDNYYQGRIQARDGAFISERNNQRIEE